MKEKEIILSTDIQRLVDARRAVLDLLGQATAALKEADRLAKEAGLGGRRDWLTQDVLHDFRYGDPLPQMQKEVDRAGWKHLMTASGMEAVMDAQARDELAYQLYESEIPELTMENVLATFQDLAARKEELFERGVINCFKSLSWDYKSNSPVAFGKKIIVNGAVTFCPDYGFGVEDRVMRRIDDLERIFHLLDGKPVPEHRCMVTEKLLSRRLPVLASHP